MDGFLNLLKPPGMSSGAAVAVIKRLTGEKVGHAGTLDPEAAGVLPVMVGRATRLLDYFSDREKEYVAQIAFGCSTDTQDAQGVVFEKSDALPDEQAILAVLPRFTGDILQRPPAYSAVKRGGRPLYALARQGVMIQADQRPAHIEKLELGACVMTGVYVLNVLCGKGTYIRTLCHDIGQALGCPAHMRFLLRTKSGPFSIENAVTLEEFSKAAKDGMGESLLLPMDYPLHDLARIDLAKRYQQMALNGVKLPLDAFPLKNGQTGRAYIGDELIGICVGADDKLVFRALVTSAVAFNAAHGIIQ